MLVVAGERVTPDAEDEAQTQGVTVPLLDERVLNWRQQWLVMGSNRMLPLPARLLRSLQELAQKYQGEGLDLFVFGSFARGD